MGLFKNLFSKKEETPTLIQQTEPVKPKGVIKSQRHKLENLEAHMTDIMELVEKNEDYKLSKKALIEDVRDNEKIYEYELNATATCCIGGGGEIQVFVSNTYIGDIKKGSRPPRLRNCLKVEISKELMRKFPAVTIRYLEM